jgi:hypothetical protein
MLPDCGRHSKVVVSNPLTSDRGPRDDWDVLKESWRARASEAASAAWRSRSLLLGTRGIVDVDVDATAFWGKSAVEDDLRASLAVDNLELLRFIPLVDGRSMTRDEWDTCCKAIGDRMGDGRWEDDGVVCVRASTVIRGDGVGSDDASVARWMAWGEVDGPASGGELIEVPVRSLEPEGGRVVNESAVISVIIRWRDPPVMVVGDLLSREADVLPRGGGEGRVAGGGNEGSVAERTGFPRSWCARVRPSLSLSSLSLSVASPHSGSLHPSSAPCSAATPWPRPFSLLPLSNHSRHDRFSSLRPFCSASPHLVNTPHRSDSPAASRSPRPAIESGVRERTPSAECMAGVVVRDEMRAVRTSVCGCTRSASRDTQAARAGDAPDLLRVSSQSCCCLGSRRRLVKRWVVPMRWAGSRGCR